MKLRIFGLQSNKISIPAFHLAHPDKADGLDFSSKNLHSDTNPQAIFTIIALSRSTRSS